MDVYTLISLAIYFAVMLGIGLYGYRDASKDVEGFALGGRKVNPAVTALSAGASDMSGWMLMGLPGAIYVAGLASSWMVLGLLIGAYANYTLVAPRLRLFTQQLRAITIPDYFAFRFQDNSHVLRIMAAVVILVFFTLYTAAGMVAGGKLFESAFGLDYRTGVYIITAVVVAYTVFGGFIAVSFTDFMQACIMLLALVLVPLVAVWQLGGASPTLAAIASLDSDLLNPFSVSSGLAVLSSMAWGLGYFGQPHIIVRFMAIRSVAALPAARRIGISWMLVTLIGATAVGLVGIAYVKINNTPLDDPETLFILFSQILFHPLLTGFLLAAILAAIMSTVSSQLLVTASTLANDLYHHFWRQGASASELVVVSRAAVVMVALVAVQLADDQHTSVLALVGNAWAGFGASFGPVILLSLFWSNMTKHAAIAGMAVGCVTVLVWLYAPLNGVSGETDSGSLSQLMYEIVPGFIMASLTIVVVSRCYPANNAAVANLHRKLTKAL